MRSSMSSLELKEQEAYSQKISRNQSRSNSPKFNIMELDSHEAGKYKLGYNRDSPGENKLTVRSNLINQNMMEPTKEQNKLNYNSSSKTRKVSMENIPPTQQYTQINNSTFQGNQVDQSLISQRGDMNSSKAYLSAMKALQEKVKLLEKKMQDQQANHAQEIERIRQEKIQIMNQSSSKNVEFEERAKQLEQQIHLIKEDADKQVRIFKQLENNLMDKLKEIELENKGLNDKDDQFQNEIKARDKEIQELREQLKLQGEQKLVERHQLKQQIQELSEIIEEMENDKEQYKRKTIFLEKQFVQYEKDLILARNDSQKEQYIKQLQDQLFQQSDFHERERFQLQKTQKYSIEQYENQQIQNQDKIAYLIKENDKLCYDWKLVQDQLIIISQEKNDLDNKVQKLLAEIHTYQEKSIQQENESKQLKELADQSRKINSQLLENIQKQYQNQSQLRLSDLQSSQFTNIQFQSSLQNPFSQVASTKLQNTYDDHRDEYLQYEKTPNKTFGLQNNINQNESYLNPHQQQFNQRLSTNRIFNSQRVASRSSQNLRSQNQSYIQHLNKSQNGDDDLYTNSQVRNSRPEKSPLRNTLIKSRELEYGMQSQNENTHKQQKEFQSSLHRSTSRNRSIDQTSRHYQGSYHEHSNNNIQYDKNIYQEQYQKLRKDKEVKKQETIEEIDDLIQQILQCEKEIIQLTAEKVDLEQEIQEFTGEKIYNDMLRIRLDNVKERIKKKTDTISYLKRKEQELNRSLKDN